MVCTSLQKENLLFTQIDFTEDETQTMLAACANRTAKRRDCADPPLKSDADALSVEQKSKTGLFALRIVTLDPLLPDHVAALTDLQEATKAELLAFMDGSYDALPLLGVTRWKLGEAARELAEEIQFQGRLHQEGFYDQIDRHLAMAAVLPQLFE